MEDATAWARFMAKVHETESGCWEWTGCQNGRGYGQLRVNGKTRAAHRFAYEHERGPVPDGLVLDHVVCDNKACANPYHVEPTTSAANIDRWRQAAKANGTMPKRSHCPKGHALTDDNVVIQPAGKRGTKRRCLLCYESWYRAELEKRRVRYARTKARRESTRLADGQIRWARRDEVAHMKEANA